MSQKKQHIFNIEHTSEIDDCVYTGSFTCKKLSVRDISQVSVLKTRFNNGYHHDPQQPGVGVDSPTDSMNHMFAHLELALVHTPDWWDLAEIGDLELVTQVFQEVAEFENSFRKRRDESDGGSEERGAQTDASAHTAGAVKQVVGDEVSASLKP